MHDNQCRVLEEVATWVARSCKFHTDAHKFFTMTPIFFKMGYFGHKFCIFERILSGKNNKVELQDRGHLSPSPPCSICYDATNYRTLSGGEGSLYTYENIKH